MPGGRRRTRNSLLESGQVLLHSILKFQVKPSHRQGPGERDYQNPLKRGKQIAAALLEKKCSVTPKEKNDWRVFEARHQRKKATGGNERRRPGVKRSRRKRSQKRAIRVD